jgi:hypothetical protein
MPRGGELSSFKVQGVGNLLHSCKKNTNPGGIARGGGMVTAGIDPCIRTVFKVIEIVRKYELYVDTRCAYIYKVLTWYLHENE